MRVALRNRRGLTVEAPPSYIPRRSSGEVINFKSNQFVRLSVQEWRWARVCHYVKTGVDLRSCCHIGVLSLEAGTARNESIVQCANRLPEPE